MSDDWTIPDAELAGQAGRHDSDHPFAEGRAAADSGLRLETNPYTRADWRCRRWADGWRVRNNELGEALKVSLAQPQPETKEKHVSVNVNSTKRGKAKEKAEDAPPAEPKRARNKPGKQQSLIDIKDKKDQPLIAQADVVKECQDERMAWGKKEAEARTLLLEMMHKRGIASYTFEDMEIKVEGVEKVKVRKKKDGDADEDE